MSSNTTQARVSYAGKPANQTPEIVARSLEMNLANALEKDIRGARAAVDSALEAGQIPDAEMPKALEFMQRSNAQLRELASERAELATKAQSPAYVRSYGDSEANLARNFSPTRAILAIAEGRQLEGADYEAYLEGKRENPQARGQVLAPAFVTRSVYGVDSTQTGIDAATNGIQTLAGPGRIALHKQPLAQQLGAQKIDCTGSNNYKLPFLGRTDMSNLAEGAGATSSASFQETTLSPNRWTRKTTLSKLSLRTTGQAMDALIINDFNAAALSTQDKVAFAAVRAAATYTAATENGTNGLEATDLEDIFNLVADYMNATGINDYPDLLASPVAVQALNTAVAANTDQTLAQVYTSQTGRRIIPVTNMVDGNFDSADILAEATTATIAGAGLIVAGDMSGLVIGQWGPGLDILVDMYGGNADADLLSIHSNLYTDAGIVNDAFRALAVSASTISAT